MMTNLNYHEIELCKFSSLLCLTVQSTREFLCMLYQQFCVHMLVSAHDLLMLIFNSCVAYDCVSADFLQISLLSSY